MVDERAATPGIKLEDEIGRDVGGGWSLDLHKIRKLDWWYSSVVQRLHSTGNAMGSIPNTANTCAHRKKK